MGRVLYHEDLEARLESDEPSPLDITNPFKVNLLKDLFSEILLLEKEQLVVVPDVQAFVLLLVHVHKDKFVMGENESSFRLVKSLKKNTVRADDLP